MVTRTRICLPAPAAHDDGGPTCWSGTASGIARISVIFTSEISEPELVPAGAHPRLVLGGRADRGRESLAAPLRASLELPGACRVDQDAVPEAGAEAGDVTIRRRRARIDRRAEDTGEDDETVLARVHTMGERPVDLLVRGRIDVLLDDGDVLVAVLRGARAPQRGRDLLGLALIRLLDLHDDVDAVGDRRHEHVTHARDARRREDVPCDRRALDGRHHAVLAVRAGQGALET